MIIVKKKGYLEHKNFKSPCALGKAGIGKKKIEGDNITPKGNFRILKVYYRKDRIKKIHTKFKLIKIKKNMGWCSDPTSKNYNQQIKLPTRFKHEKLYRKDSLYDIILFINYNINPIVKNKGSAIFIHIAKKNYKPTAGCIALKKEDLIKLLGLIKKNTKIFIN
jgi:L,D-peptidoglycan transpeptidase YkuD (ErfK/YbiS/YcfS/YnhG family)